MYVQVGDFQISRGPLTAVPLMQILHNSFFSSPKIGVRQEPSVRTCSQDIYHISANDCRGNYSFFSIHRLMRISNRCCNTSLQSCTRPVQGKNRVFPVKFSTQGKTCFHYREPLFSLQGPLFSLQGFPCEKTSQGEPSFHYREWVCSVTTIFTVRRRTLNQEIYIE